MRICADRCGRHWSKPTRDRIGELQAEWLTTMQHAAADAVRAGELRDDTDIEQLAFDLEAALLSANWYLHLLTNKDYLERARRSVRSRIERGLARVDGAVTR